MHEKFRNCKPCEGDNIVPVFEASVVQEEQQKIFDAKGKPIGERKVKHIISKALPADEMENKGYSEDLFTVANLQQAGQDPYKMQPTSQKLFAPSLDSISDTKDMLNNMDYDQLTEQDFETETNE